MVEEIKKELREFKLVGMMKTLEVRNEYAIKANLSYLEFLQLLIEDERTNREDNSLKRRLIKAKFPYIKKLEEFDFTFQPSINQKQIYDLATCRFVEKKENVVFIGQPGVGKTHLAIALGMKALFCGYKVLFTTVSDMVAQLNASRADNSYYLKSKHYLTPDLLILDELGFKRLSQQAVDDFFEIISKRYENGSIIITSNKTFEEWQQVLYDPVLASAILDRIIHHSHLIHIKGESYRMKDKIGRKKEKIG